MLLLKTILFFVGISLTGPSYISVDIRAIGINDAGEVLCKTRFSKNPWGAYRQMDVFYGYCIVTNNSIIEFKNDSVMVDIDEDWEVVAQEISKLDSTYGLALNLENTNDLETKLVSSYFFKPISLNTYKNSIVELHQIESQLNSNTQRSIRNAKSINYVNHVINVSYETDKFIFVENRIDLHNDSDKIFGAEFDFPNYIQTINSDLQNVGFDIQEVTGILFKK